MHRIRITRIGEAAVAAVHLLRQKVSASLQKRSPVVSARAVAGAIITVELMALAPVAVVPDSPVRVEACFIDTVAYGSIRTWVSNFITSDGQYFLLADGRVLFVKEE